MSGLFNQASLVLVPSGYKAGKVYSQVPTSGDGDLTFTRASDATRVNSDGLIEKVRTNLVLYSEEFNNAAWVKGNLTITENNVVSPDGTQNADLLSANGVNAPHIAYQSCSITSGTSYALSCFIKKGTNNYAQVIGGTNAFGPNVWANFDLNNGVVGSIGSSTTASITSVGDGWYRCVIIGTAIATGSNPSVVVAIVPSSTSTRGEASTLTTNIFAWGAQLEQGSTATEYIPTTTTARTTFAGITQDGTSASNVPRLDYSQGSCSALLLEPQRTNLALRSEEFDDASWTKTAVNVTANVAVSPNGYQDADKIIPTTLSSGHRLAQIVTASGTCTASFFVKADGYKKIGLQNNVSGGGQYFTADISTKQKLDGNETSFSFEDYANGFVRVIVSMPSGTTQFGFFFYVLDDAYTTGNPGLYSFSGDGTSGVYIWGAQLEQGAYATSYIKTTSATVTRLADSFTRNNIYTNGLITSNGGTWVVELRGNVGYTRDNGGNHLILADTTSQNYFRFRNDGVPNSRLRIQKAISGTLTDLTLTPSDTCKIAINWNGTTADVFINGTKEISSTSFTATQLQNLTATPQLTTFIQQMALYPTPLSDSDCIQLTTL